MTRIDAADHVMDIAAIATSTPLEIILRSLRRRLWRALVVDEDAVAALRVYQATHRDWERWFVQERLQGAVKDDRSKGGTMSPRKGSRKSVLEKRGSGRSSTGGSGLLTSFRNEKVNSRRKTLSSSHFSSSDGIYDFQSFADDQISLLYLHMCPSDPFEADDFLDYNGPYLEAQCNISSDKTTNTVGSRNRKFKTKIEAFRSGRQAFPMFRRPQRHTKFDVLERPASTATTEVAAAAVETQINQKITTPLHEAARLGYGELVRAMLRAGSESSFTTEYTAIADPNARNGMGRTALHMVAGGVTREEASRLEEMMKKNAKVAANKTALLSGLHQKTEDTFSLLGIRAPEISQVEEGPDPTPTRSYSTNAKKAVRSVGRFIIDGVKQHRHSNLTESGATKVLDAERQSQPMCSEERWYQLVMDRTDAALAILSWTHPADGSDRAGEGPSYNSVDFFGRTALHYAAELGRTDICQSLVSFFGVMLTIIDDAARTPCELAAATHQYALAAQLEARAVLYVDPYGMDDELLASVLQDNSGFHTGKLVPPFSWFTTYSIADSSGESAGKNNSATKKFLPLINEERSRRVEQALNMMTKILRKETMGLKQKGSDALKSTETLQQSRYGRASSQQIDHPLRQISKENVQGQDNTCDYQLNNVAENGGNEDGSRSSTDVLGLLKHKKYIGDVLQGGIEKIHNNIIKAKPIFPPNDKKSQKDQFDTQSTRGEFLTYGDDTSRKDITADNAELHLDKSALSYESVATNTKINSFSLQCFELLNESHTEKFLVFHSWNVTKALLSFLEDPLDAFKAASLLLPGHHLMQNDAEKKEGENQICQICCDEFDSCSPKWKDLSGCEHSFCVECLGDYIRDCAKSRSSGLVIACPYHDCTQLLSPAEVVELSPSAEDLRCLIDTSNQNFVASAFDFKFCPYPGCNGVVQFVTPNNTKLGRVEPGLLELAGAVCTANHGVPDFDGRLTYEGIADMNYYNAQSSEPPRKAHRFCFVCGENVVHWPVTCERLEEWKNTVQEQIGSVLSPDVASSVDNYNEVAQKLWLKTNTRPCPKCKIPIEKNEGCNHMTCSNLHCKYEFCWICRNDWKLHNTETGGFFRCNRWVDQKEHIFYDNPPTEEDMIAAKQDIIIDPSMMAATYGTAMHEARVHSKKSRDMARFLHHYQRYSAHAESAALEQVMSASITLRLAPVVLAAIEVTGQSNFNFGDKGLSFVYAAFTELLECRSMLRYSYAYSYFRYQTQHHKKHKLTKRLSTEKVAFEQLQSELEMMTEQMSDVVARSHLRATQMQIIFLTTTATEKRKELSNLMIRILVSDKKDSLQETTPVVAIDELTRKIRRSRSLPTLLEQITNLPASNLSDSSSTSNSAVPRIRPEEDDEEMEEAIRASLEDFVASDLGSQARTATVPYWSDLLPHSNFESEVGENDWACSACTYVNALGIRCVLCGTLR